MSIIFIIICFVILIVVLAAISSPFLKKDPTTPELISQEAAEDQERADLSVEREVLRQSLQELDVELAQGRLEQEDYDRLKATDERRLIDVLDRLEALAATQTHESSTEQTKKTGAAWGSAIAASLIVLVLSVGIYSFLQWRTINRLVDIQTQMTAQQGPDPREMVARLEARLKKNPDDAQGHMMAGRSYMALNRADDAKKAYEKVLELDARNHEAHYNLGIIMIEERKFDDPKIFETALKHFDAVLVDLPNQPGVNWYKGLALWYLKRHRETEEFWATAHKNLEPGSQDAEFVKQALAKLRDGETPF
ncbi:MAG: c-type cytochrome biogenesis protein CcmI [Nitrospirota bacterium]|nr:c-type cytochrome biogenesis protein CcmI [Nitrospirota bacterium]